VFRNMPPRFSVELTGSQLRCHSDWSRGCDTLLAASVALNCTSGPACGNITVRPPLPPNTDVKWEHLTCACDDAAAGDAAAYAKSAECTLSAQVDRRYIDLTRTDHAMMAGASIVLVWFYTHPLISLMSSVYVLRSSIDINFVRLVT
jgi:hypothetical protein